MQPLKACFKILLFTGLVTGLIACGGGSGGDGNNTDITGTTPAINGTAATGKAIDGIVYVTDGTGIQINVSIDSSGNYTADISAMTPPFILSAVPANISLPTQYSYATGPGTTSITPLTTLALFNATSQSDLGVLEANWLTRSGDIIQANLELAQAQINANFATLFSTQSIDANTYDIFSDPFSVGTGFDMVLDSLVIDIDFPGGTFFITSNGNGFNYDFNIDISGVNIGGTGVIGAGNDDFGTLDIIGSDAGVFGGGFTPDSVASNGPPVSSITWATILANAGSDNAALAIAGISGASLDSATIIFTYTRSTPPQSYGYGLACFASPAECAEITVNQADKTMIFNKLVIDNTSGNSATASITISGTLNWP